MHLQENVAAEVKVLLQTRGNKGAFVSKGRYPSNCGCVQIARRTRLLRQQGCKGATCGGVMMTTKTFELRRAAACGHRDQVEMMNPVSSSEGPAEGGQKIFCARGPTGGVFVFINCFFKPF